MSSILRNDSSFPFLHWYGLRSKLCKHSAAVEIHTFWNDDEDYHSACERGWLSRRVVLQPLASKAYSGNGKFQLAQEVSADEVG